MKTFAHCAKMNFLFVDEIFGNKFLPLVIHSVDPVDSIDPVCTQRPLEQISKFPFVGAHSNIR